MCVCVSVLSVCVCVCVCVLFPWDIKLNALIGKGRNNFFPPHSLQVIFPEKHWLPQDKLSQLEALLPPRQKVRITEDMDQVELKEFNPNEQNWRQHREAYEEDDDGPRAGVQCQTA